MPNRTANVVLNPIDRVQTETSGSPRTMVNLHEWRTMEFTGTEDAQTRLLTNRALDITQMAAIFHEAGYQVSIKDKHIEVMDGGVTTIVGVPGDWVYRMQRYCVFYEGASQHDRLWCVNSINKEIHAGRAYCDDNDNPVIEAVVYVRAGLSPAQVLGNFQLFNNQVDWLLLREDISDVIEEC